MRGSVFALRSWRFAEINDRRLCIRGLGKKKWSVEPSKLEWYAVVSMLGRKCNWFLIIRFRRLCLSERQVKPSWSEKFSFSFILLPWCLIRLTVWWRASPVQDLNKLLITVIDNNNDIIIDSRNYDSSKVGWKKKCDLLSTKGQFCYIHNQNMLPFHSSKNSPLDSHHC